MDILFEHFSKLPLFEKLNMKEFDYHQIQRLYNSMKYEYFDQGEKVFNYGDIGDKFYIILQGKVSVRVPKIFNYSFTRNELLKFILKNYGRIDLNDEHNLRFIEFAEIAEALQKHQNGDFGDDQNDLNFEDEKDYLAPNNVLKPNLSDHELKIVMKILSSTSALKYFCLDISLGK